MIVLVCGGRDWAEVRTPRGAGPVAIRAARALAARQRIHLYKTMDKLHSLTPITLLITGEASGADSCAKGWAYLTRLPYKGYKAQWDKHGRGAGPIRNARMLSEGKPNLVVAFPGGAGTADMVAQAHRAGVEVRAISFDEHADIRGAVNDV